MTLAVFVAFIQTLNLLHGSISIIVLVHEMINPFKLVAVKNENNSPHNLDNFNPIKEGKEGKIKSYNFIFVWFFSST